jgi:hypothetical protein
MVVEYGVPYHVSLFQNCKIGFCETSQHQSVRMVIEVPKPSETTGSKEIYQNHRE